MGGEIDVKSVCPTRRGALVNWLYTKGFKATGATTDAEIEAAWQALGQYADAIEVEIAPVPIGAALLRAVHDAA